MQKLIRGLTASFLLLLISYNAYSTHMAGADLTYEYIGNHQYRITYTFYRDCIGIDAQSFITLNYGSASCNIQLTDILEPVVGTGQLISFVCPGAITTCDGGTALGIQKWEYSGIVTIDQQCPDWSFSVSDCCRNAAITTIFDAVNQDMYIEANLNNTISENNSPIFSNVPIAIECIGQDNFYNHGGYDVDGDSLVYDFFIPYHAPNSPLTYNTGYTIAEPITSSPPVNINHSTGDIFMHPIASEIAVISVKITEFRNGEAIGAVVRDLQIYTMNCNNNLPTATGINGTNSFNYTACAGGQICFDIFTSDPDAADSLKVLWNQTIPAATFTIDSSSAFPTIHFCWTTTNADIRPQPYFFTVTVYDDACPSSGVQSFAYSITLNSLNASIASTPATCEAEDGSATVSTNGGSGNFTFDWQPNVSSSTTAQNIPAGIYSVTVTDVSNNCSQVLTTIVNNSAGVEATIISTQDATCESGEDGSAIVNGSGGTTPYSYLWTPGGSDDSVVTNLAPGTYTVMVTDYNDCPAFATVTIGYRYSSPDLNLGGDTVLCIGTSYTLDAGNGYSYIWSNNMTTQTISVTQPGNYNVLITDTNSCTSFDNINVGFITCMGYRPNDELLSSIVAYPNPVTDKVQIYLSDFIHKNVKNESVTLKVYDSQSHLLHQSKYNLENKFSQEIDLSFLPPGIYILEINAAGTVRSIRLAKI